MTTMTTTAMDEELMYGTDRWLRERELRRHSGYTVGQVIERHRDLCRRLLQEFTWRDIRRHGLDNPYATDDALATMASSTREHLARRKHGAPQPTRKQPWRAPASLTATARKAA